MKKAICVGMALALLTVVGTALYAEDMTEITGEAIDLPCYVQGKSGPGHAACSKACAEKGEPLAIVSKDAAGKETLYVVIGSGGKSAKDLLSAHMGTKVTATGLVSDKGGVKILSVVQVKAAAA